MTYPFFFPMNLLIFQHSFEFFLRFCDSFSIFWKISVTLQIIGIFLKQDFISHLQIIRMIESTVLRLQL